MKLYNAFKIMFSYVYYIKIFKKIFLIFIFQFFASSYLIAVGLSQCGATGIKPSALVNVYNNKKKYPNFTMICAHRGLWIHRNYPQNSLASFQEAINAGIDCIENDIKWSKDDAPVIFHDPNLDMMVVDSKKNPVKGKIEDYTLKQLESFYLRDRLLNITNYKIIRLEQFIDISRGKIIENHEIKMKKSQVGPEVYSQRMVDLFKILKNKNVLSESIVKGELTSEEYKNVLKKLKVFGITPDAINFVPKFFRETPNVETEIREFNSLGISSYELVVENDDSPLIRYFGDLDKEYKRYGAFDLVPESGRGRYVSANQWKKIDPAKDFRGNWDWIFNGGYSFIITDRPCLMSQYLTSLDRRQL